MNRADHSSADDSGERPGVILVTGGTGIIGRALVGSLCADGLPVRVLTRRPELVRALFPSVEAMPGDLEEGVGLAEACRGATRIFHLASYAPPPTTPNPEAGPQHWRVTAEGTERLLHAARQAGAGHFIFVSSVRALPGPGEIRPHTPYGVAKQEAERLVQQAGIPFTILRLPVVYGSGTQGNLARMIAAIDQGRFPPLPELGNRRAMIHRDDVVYALRLIAEKAEARGRIYTLGDGQPYSTRRIQEAIRAALGRPPLRWSIPIGLLRLAALGGDLLGRLTGLRPPLDSGILSKLTDSLWFDTSEIERELGFRPRQTLEGALPEMVREYEMHNAKAAK